MPRTLPPGPAHRPAWYVARHGCEPNGTARKRYVRPAWHAKRPRRRPAARRRQPSGSPSAWCWCGAVVAFLTTRGDDSTDVATTGTTTTVAGEHRCSAAGKPCVAVADPCPPAPRPSRQGRPAAHPARHEDLKPGTGATVAAKDTVTVNYIGVSCSTGKIFDSSYERGQPATFSLTGVIKGWTDGIPGMKVGGQRLLGIPPEQGYGPPDRRPTSAPTRRCGSSWRCSTPSRPEPSSGRSRRHSEGSGAGHEAAHREAVEHDGHVVVPHAPRGGPGTRHATSPPRRATPDAAWAAARRRTRHRPRTSGRPGRPAPLSRRRSSRWNIDSPVKHPPTATP